MSADLAAVNPSTGEVLEHLEQQPPEALAETLADIHARQAEMKRWGDALEAELRRRLKVRQTTTAVYGAWEVSAARSRKSEWDAAELEPAMQRLADEGVIRAGDWTGVITRDPVVSRSKAAALLGQLDGAAAEAVKACRTWKDKPGPLTVTRSVELPPPAEQPVVEAAAVEAPPDLGPGCDGSEPETQVPAGPPRPPAPPSPPTLNPEELFA